MLNFSANKENNLSVWLISR